MRYAVVIEKAGDNYSAYVPDIPGCVATGDAREEAEREIRAAVRFHLTRGSRRTAWRCQYRRRL
jgi:predicted RNase H-like HicB family nuclease